jgi:hypothetical protein
LSFEISFARFTAIADIATSAKARKKWLPAIPKNWQTLSWLDLIMILFSALTEDTALKLKAAKSVLIKIKN